MKKSLRLILFLAALSAAFAAGTTQRSSLSARAGVARALAEVFTGIPYAEGYFTGRAEAFEEAAEEFGK